MFAYSNSVIRTKLEIYSQLTITTLEWRYLHRSSVFSLNLEQLSHLTPAAKFEQVIPCWDGWYLKQSLSKNLFFRLILQLLKFVLQHI